MVAMMVKSYDTNRALRRRRGAVTHLTASAVTSILYDDAVIITQQLQSQLVLDIEHVMNSLADPPMSEEWDEFGRVGNPFINDSIVQAALDHACQNAKGWETPQDRGRFYHFLAAEIAIQLIEYRDNILLSGEPPSHQMTLVKKLDGMADWTFLQVCGLYTAARIVSREYETHLRLDSRPDLVKAFKAHLDRVAKGVDPPVKDLADIVQVLARDPDDRHDDHQERAVAMTTPAETSPTPTSDADEAVEATPVGEGFAGDVETGHPDAGDAPMEKLDGGEEAAKGKAGRGWVRAAVVVGVVVVVVAATAGGSYWGRSWWPTSSPATVADSPGPQLPPFPRDALAEVGMPVRPNVLLRLTGVSDGIQRWTSQSVSGSAPALPVPLDITPLPGEANRHKVIKVTLDLQLRDPGTAADPGLLISASGDYPLSIKDGGDYSTTLITPEQQNPKSMHPLTAKGDDTPLSLEKDGVWTFQFFVDLGDPSLYQCGYHVRSITAFAEFDPKYPASVRPNSKIVDTLPVALLRTC